MAKKPPTSGKAAASAASIPKKKFRCSVDLGHAREIPHEIATDVLALEKTIGKPIWMFVQHGDDTRRWGMINPLVRDAILHAVRTTVPKGTKIALLIDSPGGIPQSAFQIAMSLRRHCGGFDAIVPKYAKSAATLLALGADDIILGEDAELGPIDMQVSDPDTEDSRSVLEYVQSLERLEAYTLRFFDDAMTLLLHRTHKKVGTLLPSTVELVTNVVRPLFENVDVVQYTQMARLLKVMEDYASRLMFRKFGDKADDIAKDITSQYADHSFVIDREEAERLGLRIAAPNADRDKWLSALSQQVHNNIPSMIGRVEEYHD